MYVCTKQLSQFSLTSICLYVWYVCMVVFMYGMYLCMFSQYYNAVDINAISYAIVCMYVYRTKQFNYTLCFLKADVTVKISPDLSPDQVADKVGKNFSCMFVCMFISVKILRMLMYVFVFEVCYLTIPIPYIHTYIE